MSESIFRGDAYEYIAPECVIRAGGHVAVDELRIRVVTERRRFAVSQNRNAEPVATSFN